jgi:hypothetical protein
MTARSPDEIRGGRSTKCCVARLGSRPRISLRSSGLQTTNTHASSPGAKGAGPPFSLIHFHHDSPKGGSSAPRGRFGTNFRDCKTRTRIQFGSGVRTASRRAVAGTFRKCFSEICTALSRWASPVQLVPYFAPPTRPLGLIDATPAFSATARVGRPPVAPSLLPKVISDKKPMPSGPAFSLRFRLVIRKRSL